MIINLYSVFDAATNAYLQPMYALSKGQIIRGITEAVNDPKHDFCKYARDYTLFELGTFDDSTAKFNLLPTPRSLGLLVEFVHVERVHNPVSLDDCNRRSVLSDDVN